jgi:hypothetical protein
MLKGLEFIARKIGIHRCNCHGHIFHERKTTLAKIKRKDWKRETLETKEPVKKASHMYPLGMCSEMKKERERQAGNLPASFNRILNF